MSIVQLIPSDPMVTDAYERSFSTAYTDGGDRVVEIAMVLERRC